MNVVRRPKYFLEQTSD